MAHSVLAPTGNIAPRRARIVKNIRRAATSCDFLHPPRPLGEGRGEGIINGEGIRSGAGIRNAVCGRAAYSSCTRQGVPSPGSVLHIRRMAYYRKGRQSCRPGRPIKISRGEFRSWRGSVGHVKRPKRVRRSFREGLRTHWRRSSADTFPSARAANASVTTKDTGLR